MPKVHVAGVVDAIKSLIEILDPHCEKIIVAGSVRRKETYVSDVELVILPKPSAYDTLDAMIKTGKSEYKMYGTKKPRKRWGEKARGMIYQGVVFDMYFTVPENFGYILWMRTGPAKANEYIMRQSKRPNCPFLFKGGFVRDGATDEALNVTDEIDMFAVLGIDSVILPEKRSESAYHEAFSSPAHEWGDVDDFLPPTLEQQAMGFQLEPISVTYAESEGTNKPAKDTETETVSAFEWSEIFLHSPDRVYVYEGYGNFAIYNINSDRAQLFLKTLQDSRYRETVVNKLLKPWLSKHKSDLDEYAPADLVVKLMEVFND